MSTASDTIIRTFAEHGHLAYGEEVTVRAHSLQTAWHAKARGGDANLILAALLHDYGHLVHTLGEDIADHGVDAHHERLGADALAELGLAPAIVEPIRLHVLAKRYLCATEAGYQDRLSEASAQSLALQGGPLPRESVEAFEAHPHFGAALELRRCDDLGKVPEAEVGTLNDYLSLLK